MAIFEQAVHFQKHYLLLVLAALIKFAAGALSGTLEAHVLSCAAAALSLSLKSNPRISPHHKGKCQGGNCKKSQ